MRRKIPLDKVGVTIIEGKIGVGREKDATKEMTGLVRIAEGMGENCARIMLSLMPKVVITRLII